MKSIQAFAIFGLQAYYILPNWQIKYQEPFCGIRNQRMLEAYHQTKTQPQFFN